MKKISLFLLSILTVLSVMIPIGGIAAAEQADTSYAFPAEYTEKLDSRYVKLDIDKLDACLYALLNYNGEVEYRLVVEQAHEDHTDIGLMPVTLQHAVVHDEDQPEILITVHPDKGFIEDEWFLTSFSKQLKKQAKKGKLTVETEFGDIVFDLDNMQKKAKKDPHKGKTPSTTDAPSENPTTKPSGETATATPKPTAKPSENPITNPPSNPTSAPTAAPTSAPTAAPTTNPTNPPEPTAAPTAAPTAQPTPSGHYERRWVVDKPAVTHDEWVCSCGHHSMSSSENNQHQKNHALNGESTWWQVITVTDSPEEGHWEEVWVQDP